MAFLEGWIVMFTELLGGKILYPYYGHYLPIWATVIGVSFAALAAGYYLGGLLSQRPHPLIKLGWMWVVAGAWLFTIPWLGNALLAKFYRTGTITSGYMLTALLTITPVLLPLGTTTSILIGVQSQTQKQSGKTAGTIYAISTTGALASALITGIILLPWAGLTLLSFLHGGIAAMIAGMLLWGSPSGFYSGMGVQLLFLLTGILLKPAPRFSSSSTILEQRESLIGQLLVADTRIGEHTYRILFTNRSAQTWIETSTGLSAWSYIPITQAIYKHLRLDSPASTALVMGLGGGTLVTTMWHDGIKKIDVVEIDPQMVRLARKYFRLPSAINIIVDDARHFVNHASLRNPTQRYNIVFMDAWIELVPHQLVTREMFTALRKIMDTSGILIINYFEPVDSSSATLIAMIFKALELAGFHTLSTLSAEPAGGRNLLLVATPSTATYRQLKEAPVLKSTLLDQHRQVMALLPSTEVPPLSDNRPVSDVLSIPVAVSFRVSHITGVWRYLYGDEPAIPFYW